MLKKIFRILLVCLITIVIYGSVYAVELKNQLDVIQKASEIKYLENEQGYITNEIVDLNAENGEVTIELKVNNNKKDQESMDKSGDTEVYLLVSENIVNNEKIFTKNFNNIEKLITKIFSQNSKVKIGIIGIKGTVADIKLDEETGNIIVGDKDESFKNGSSNDAEIVAKLTNNIDEIKSGLQNMNSSKTAYRSNLQAAIRLANKSYSKNSNKILISLYDDVPEIAIGVPVAFSIVDESSTAEEMVSEVHEKISTNTRNEILTLKSSKISFILLRPDDTSYDEKWFDSTTGEFQFDFDGSSYVQKIYGTIDNPSYGKMYSFTDENVDKIITENIFKDVNNLIPQDMNTVKIVAYFPDEIINNFDFSYVDQPSIGSSSNSIDAKDKSITWNIGTLKGSETATLKYKLKIKDMNNTDILEKTISTNEKLVLTYKDLDSKDYTTEVKSSPKIKLSKITQELTATVSYNPNTTTTGDVKATIKTNKKVNEVDGWTLLEDGMTLTKTYSKNMTEKVHLVDFDGMTKDVYVNVNNIKTANSGNNNSNNSNNNSGNNGSNNYKNDTTVASGILPRTGVNILGLSAIFIMVIFSVICYKKFNNYKDIK